jgi:hypothetical protein
MSALSNTSTIAWFSDLGLAELDQVGGKNASLGEMVRNLTSAAPRYRTASLPLQTRTDSSLPMPAWSR